MNNNVKTLKTKLKRSERRTMLIATICNSNQFVAKALNAEQKDVTKSLNKWKKEWENVDTDKLDNIANNVIMALTDSSKGANALERAKNFLTALTSLSFESKDEFELDDYCNAVAQLRLIQKMILPKEKIMDDEKSKNTTNKIKNFVAGEKMEKEDTNTSDESPVNFLTRELNIANMWAQNVESRTESDKKKMDNDEAECAKMMIGFITANEHILSICESRLEEFAYWVAEQLYGLKPEIVESVSGKSDNHALTNNLFGQYITWLKSTDPDGYLDWIAKYTASLNKQYQSKKTNSNESAEKNNRLVKQETQQEEPTSKKQETQQEEPTSKKQETQQEEPTSKNSLNDDSIIDVAPPRFARRNVRRTILASMAV